MTSLPRGTAAPIVIIHPHATDRRMLRKPRGIGLSQVTPFFNPLPPPKV